MINAHRLETLADDGARNALSLLTNLRQLAHQLRPTAPAVAPQRPTLTMVQFGDYRDAYERFRDGGAENYYAQRYTVDFVASLARDERVAQVNVISFGLDTPLAELAPRLWTGGVELYPTGRPIATEPLLQMVAKTRPSHLLVAMPFAPLIRFGLDQRYNVLPLFADSFRGGGLKQRVKNALLAYALNDPRIPFVSNHNLAAALDLVRIGVDANKVVPFDWPALITPSAHPVKRAPASDQVFRLLFVGQLNEPKGVGDLIRAVAELERSQENVSLSLIGSGEEPELRALSERLGVSQRVSFLGKRTHSEVQEAMRSHDAVVVPSRHAYPEGLPMTLYEALCSRSPILASDHPMFALRIRDGWNALVFRAEDPVHLAARVRELKKTPATYEALSRNAETAASDYLCPLKWDRLLTAWLSGDTAPFSSNAVAQMSIHR